MSVIDSFEEELASISYLAELALVVAAGVFGIGVFYFGFIALVKVWCGRIGVGKINLIFSERMRRQSRACDDMLTLEFP